MARYIDKDALVAEIERRINEINLDSIEDWRYRLQREHDIEVMKNILSLIDTLEAKEVDLNEEIKSYFKGFGKFPSVGIDDCIDIAKHFFEFRLKAQKEE